MIFVYTSPTLAVVKYSQAVKYESAVIIPRTVVPIVPATLALHFESTSPNTMKLSNGSTKINNVYCI